MSARLSDVLSAIDAANAEDPNLVTIDGTQSPAELVYGRRMTETLEQFYPQASDELQIAARGQHIRRWTSKRADYPEGRVGYLKWRTDLKKFHADTLADIMARHGYDEARIARVCSIVRKERMKQDEEAQALEDVVCLVFLEHYFTDFAAKHESDKIIDIVRKTWRKMSERGHQAALALDLPEDGGNLISAALAGAE